MFSDYMCEHDLQPLLSALESNTQLRRLRLPRPLVEIEFARDVMLPAIRANTSLRRLAFNGEVMWAELHGMLQDITEEVAARR